MVKQPSKRNNNQSLYKCNRAAFIVMYSYISFYFPTPGNALCRRISDIEFFSLLFLIFLPWQHGDFGNDLAAMSRNIPSEEKVANREFELEGEPSNANLNSLLSKKKKKEIQLNPAIAHFKGLIKLRVFAIAKILWECFLKQKFLCFIGGVLLKQGAL